MKIKDLVEMPAKKLEYGGTHADVCIAIGENIRLKEIANLEVSDEALQKVGYIKKDSVKVDIKGLQGIVILNTLQSIFGNEEYQPLVFKCCGKPMETINKRGECPHCGTDNTEVINLWKYYLIRAIADNIGDIIKGDNNG